MSFAAKYTTAAKIAAAIKANASAHAKVDDEWQAIGMSVMAHIWEHRDVSVVNNLVIPMYNGLGKGARHAAMSQWLLTFLPVVANTDAATKATHPFKFSKDKALLQPDFDQAANQQWFSMKPSPAPDQVFDFNAIFAQAVKKACKAAAEGKPILGNRDALVAAAAAMGIPESDLPSKSATFVKNKAELEALTKAEAQATATAEPATT